MSWHVHETADPYSYRPTPEVNARMIALLTARDALDLAPMLGITLPPPPAPRPPRKRKPRPRRPRPEHTSPPIVARASSTLPPMPTTLRYVSDAERLERRRARQRARALRAEVLNVAVPHVSEYGDTPGQQLERLAALAAAARTEVV